MADLVMPRLSDTMEEGTILLWLKRDGEELRRGEELVEIETDKATMTYQSDLAGVLQIVAGEGETLAVGALIAHVGPPEAGRAAPVDEPRGGARAAEPAGTPEPARDNAPGRVLSGDARASPERVRASPLARRIARESGVDLRTLSGSGPGGRIVRADVQDAPAPAPAPAAAPAPASAPALDSVATAKGETTIVELTRAQQTIARRMAESKATIPDFSLQSTVDMQECAKLRVELKRLSPDEAPTYNDMVVKACAIALREHPRANGSYRDGHLELHARVNVGVAVAAEDTLTVPTVFDADEKSLGEIARETRALADRVRAGAITPPELGGGTFSVSNLGMYGVASFTAIVNPPQAAILSVGSVQPRAIVRDGELLARHTMTLTLACDHRILYGADAARFLARIRELLEAPAALTL